MKTDDSAFQQVASRALTGKGAHALTADVFGGLNWQIAGVRPMGIPHSVFQLVNHIVFWEEWGVQWLGGKSPKVPAHAAGSWPGKVRPVNRSEWNRTVRRHREALKALHRGSRCKDLLIKRGNRTPLEMLHLIASHTSYHVGEVVMMRQMLASWPPPSGGLTW